MTDTTTMDGSDAPTGVRAARIASVLLVVTAVLFGIGAASEDEAHAETGVEADAVGGGRVEEAASEAGDPPGQAEADHHEAAEAPGEGDEGRVLGVDVESPLAVGAAIAVSLALAAGLWVTGRRRVAQVVVAFGLVFAILDSIEANHQLDESRRGLAALVATIAAGHLAAAAAAGYAATRAPAGSPPR